MKKAEFSKKLLFADYIIFIVLIILTILYPEVDFITLDVAWIAQTGISATAYYWKTKSDNKTKIPIRMIKSLPKEMRDDVDVTQIMIASIQSD